MKTPRQEILHLVICLNCLKNGNTEQDCTVEGSNITCTQCKKNQGVFNHNLNQVSFLQSRAEDRLEEKVEKEKFLPKNWSRWRNQNADFLKDLSSDSGLIVDIGCGPGVFHPIFEGATIIGVDFMSYENVNIVTDLEEELPLKGECASICLMTNFLEHSYKPIVALKSAWRILKPGGRVIITVPFLMLVHQAPYDYHRYTPFFFCELLRNAVFKSIDLTLLMIFQHFFHLLSASTATIFIMEN
jgi:SAM-dependent methyltransferase